MRSSAEQSLNAHGISGFGAEEEEERSDGGGERGDVVDGPGWDMMRRFCYGGRGLISL